MLQLIRTLTLSPFALVHVAALSQTILMIFLILFPRDFKLEERQNLRILMIFREMGSGLFSIIGILFIDTAVMWLLGAWTYLDWKFHLPGVILLLFVGIQYVWHSLLRRPTILEILYFLIACATILFFFHSYVPRFEVMSVIIEDNIGIIIGALFAGYCLVKFTIIAHGTKKIDNTKQIQTNKFLNPIWDNSSMFGKVYNHLTNTISWTLLVLQSMFTFYGYSLFYWP